MSLHPILASLRHHRLATLLIVLQIALACAVMCNACSLIAARWHAMQLVSGVDESSLGALYLTGYEPQQANDLNARMLEGLRRIPGVTSVNIVNTVPFGPQAGTVGVTLDPAGKRFGGVVDFYLGTPGTLEAMGVKVIEGRAPTAEEYRVVEDFVPHEAGVLVTRSLANHLWPGDSPLGKEFWIDHFHYRVIGVLQRLAIAVPGSRGAESSDWSVYAPALAGPRFAGTYMLRAAPTDLPGVMHKAREAVASLAPDAVLTRETSLSIPELRTLRFANDKAMMGILFGIIIALLLVTALGIVGLASFWVARRRKQIGIRRAIGATRRDILHYFQLENFLIVSMGIVAGGVLAYGISIGLMMYSEVPLLPPSYFAAGAVVLWSLGQLAVLGPALRAAAVPPVAATRAG
ncbi:ABC transporter permease [Luteibacter sp.]|uniref:ABC transporter permease n=1 Tax=Luteibacter sp. TaxID=1886636 RepID=UPI003F805F5F